MASVESKAASPPGSPENTLVGSELHVHAKNQENEKNTTKQSRKVADVSQTTSTRQMHLLSIAREDPQAFTLSA